jgi:transketolase
MFAAHHRLGRLTVVLDANNSQVDGPVTSVTTIEPILGKWRAFGWQAVEVDGHDAGALLKALTPVEDCTVPSIVVGRTDILGKLRAIPRTADGHFLKLEGGLREAIEAELETHLA